MSSTYKWWNYMQRCAGSLSNFIAMALELDFGEGPDRKKDKSWKS